MLTCDEHSTQPEVINSDTFQLIWKYISEFI